MDQAVFLLATVDIASTWDVADKPFVVAQPRLKPGCGNQSHCPVCGNPARGHDAKAEQRRDLCSLLNEAHRHAVVPCVSGPDQPKASNRVEVEVPWGRPGTGCTQLFEALVMALIRRMPVKRAAAILGSGDDRLWRVIGPDNEIAQGFAEELTLPAEKAAHPGAVSAELFRTFALAVIYALLKGAHSFGPFGAKEKDALGKVGAEEGMLYPSRSRAPPKTLQT